MSRPNVRPLLALLVATMAVSACSRGNVPGAAMVRGAGPSEAHALAQREAFAELDAFAHDDAPTMATSGLQADNFRSLDRDGNGRLEGMEKTAALQQVWAAMTAIGEARKAPTNGDDDVRPDPKQEYTVAHPLTYGPAEAEVFIDAAEIMPAVFQTLKAATKTIRMDLFLLGGTEGQKLAELLVAKQKEGVEIRIIHDPGYGLAGEAHAQIVPVIKFLLANGVAVKSFPLSYLQKRRGHALANRFQIDHNKFLIVDRQVAMVGTMNLIDLGVMNHDIYVRITGSAAEELAAIHDATWQLKGASTPNFREEKRPPAPPAPRKLELLNLPVGLNSLPAIGLPGFSSDGSVARVIKTDIDAQTTKTVTLQAFKEARKTIHVSMFEFGDTDIANALVDAYKRGVEVRVIADKNANYDKYLDAFKSIKLYGTPNLVTTNILREGGVPVKWYIPQVEDQENHMKLAVVDGQRVLVGSTNYTYQAFRTFRETNLDIVSKPAADRLEAMFQRDWDQRGTPVTKPNFFEKCVMTAVKAFDKFNLSWW